MSLDLNNWKTQVRKGYLELCLLLLIRKHGSIYGFDLLEKLRQMDMHVKEGTLYPLLSRMTTDATLAATWQTDNLKGHPRKFYALTDKGNQLVDRMSQEFSAMTRLFQELH